MIEKWSKQDLIKDLEHVKDGKLPVDTSLIPAYISSIKGIGTNRYAEAYQVGYERKFIRQDGQSPKTMTYQSH